MITLIAAQAGNRVIGNGDDIPWYLPEDFKHFKRTTLGHPIVMGRTTWDSLPKKPLPNRVNIVVSRSLLQLEGATTFTTIDEALEYARSFEKEVFVIGGQQIYDQTIQDADRLLITHVEGEHTGDKYFPHIAPDLWTGQVLREEEAFRIIDYRRSQG